MKELDELKNAVAEFNSALEKAIKSSIKVNAAVSKLLNENGMDDGEDELRHEPHE